MNQVPQKTALVTGAAKRIGHVIALTLAQRGWDVAVHYHQSEADAHATVRAIEATGRRAVALQCDLGDAAAVQQLLPQAIAALGPVSCVVNNASLFDYDSAESFSALRLDQHMRVNLTAPVLLAQSLHALTPEGQQAVVINLLDQKLYNMNPDFFSYTLSKAALQSATVMLAQALGPKLRVVGIAPGITVPSGNQSPAEFARAHSISPLGRSSTTEDIAATVCFIADTPGITGSTLVVDGGQHLIPLERDVVFVAKTK